MSECAADPTPLPTAPRTVSGTPPAAWTAGLGPWPLNASATNELFSVLYGELHRQAGHRMRRERADHTLSATALTNELWFRLSEQTRTVWQSEQHFLGVAGILMRRILVNHAQARATDKRQGDRVDFTESMPVAAAMPSPELLRVHEALLAFEQVDARAAKVVELKFFAGLEGEEIAAVLGVSVPTVKRDWAWARAWLHRELADNASPKTE